MKDQSEFFHVFLIFSLLSHFSLKCVGGGYLWRLDICEASLQRTSPTIYINKLWRKVIKISSYTILVTFGQGVFLVFLAEFLNVFFHPFILMCKMNHEHAMFNPKSNNGISRSNFLISTLRIRCFSKRGGMLKT